MRFTLLSIAVSSLLIAGCTDQNGYTARSEKKGEVHVTAPGTKVDVERQGPEQKRKVHVDAPGGTKVDVDRK